MTKQCESREMGVGARCAFLDGHGGDHRYPSPGQDLTDAIRWRVASDEHGVALRKILKIEVERNAAYRERNACVALIAHMATAGFMGGRAWVAKHPPDLNWDPEWMNIVFVELRDYAIRDRPDTYQLSWHIHDSELPLFANIPHYFEIQPPEPWDGHTTVEKYERMKWFCR